MHILVLHRVPDSLVHYADNLDHTAHEVTYVGVPERLHSTPQDVPCRRIERPGTGDTATEVLAAVADLPVPDRVIALSEYDLLAAGQVREALGLPGPHEAEVLPSRDKVLMKAAVERAGLRVPRFMALPDALSGGAETVPWSGKTVLKPRSGASSEGVRSFASVVELLDHAGRDALALQDYEIEEFVEGPIIHVDGLVADGEAVAVLASRYVGTCLGYAEGKPLGSVQIATTAPVVDWTLSCLRAVGIDTGPFHLEAIESADGLVFLEVGARFGGADVVDTFELATGVRMPSSQLRLLVEGSDARPAVRPAQPDECYGWFVWPGHALNSTLCRIGGEQSFREDPLVWRWAQRRHGEPLTQLITYADADVPLAGIVGPASSRDLEQFLCELFQTVRVDPAEPDAVQ
ncbi:MAG: ATP-grasp domain-containing protein [Actinomycetota bacterium]|nr:ATP-grasp domain-containing protein [Actinomycetota bacterium]